MADKSRTLKLSILGDVDQLNKSLKSANDDVEKSSGKMGDFGKKAGLAFAAAGIAAAAYAVKIGVDGVKAAIEDEAAQVRLATALTNATGATDAMIASVEKQILATSLATGVADDQLRPALQRLALSTGDVSKAQDLLNLSLDISQATGKSLDSVANALGKAYDGNATSLGKLGIGLSAAELKAMSFTEVQEKLSDLFGGSAAANAETFEGRMARLKIAFSESVETIGFALLPILEKFVDLITIYVLPIVQTFSDAMSSKSSTGLGKRIEEVVATIKTFAMPIFNGLVTVFNKVKDAIISNSDQFESFYAVVRRVAPVVGKILGGMLVVIGHIASVVITVFAAVLGQIEPAIDRFIDKINFIIKGINLIRPGEDIKLVSKISTRKQITDLGMIPGSEAFTIPAIPDIAFPDIKDIPGAAGAGISSAASSGKAAAIALSPSVAQVGMLGGLGAGVIAGVTGQGQNASVAQVGMLGGLGAGVVGGVNITVNQGIVGDQESAARAVVEVLNNSFYRGTGGSNALVAS